MGVLTIPVTCHIPFPSAPVFKRCPRALPSPPSPCSQILPVCEVYSRCFSCHSCAPATLSFSEQSMCASRTSPGSGAASQDRCRRQVQNRCLPRTVVPVDDHLHKWTPQALRPFFVYLPPMRLEDPQATCTGSPHRSLQTCRGLSLAPVQPQNLDPGCEYLPRGALHSTGQTTDPKKHSSTWHCEHCSGRGDRHGVWA